MGKNLIPALDSFIVISCTVVCTLGEQIVFRLKTQNWTIQNWGPCSCAQAMSLPTPLPSKTQYRRNLLKWLDALSKQCLHYANYELQMQVSARELERNWMHHSFSNLAVDTEKLRSRLLWASKVPRTQENAHCLKEKHSFHLGSLPNQDLFYYCYRK